MARLRFANSAANGTNHGFEDYLWAAIDTLRNHMDSAEYGDVEISPLLMSGEAL